MGLPHRYTQVMSVQLNTQSSLSWYMCPYGLEMQARLFLRDFLHQGSNTQSVCIGASVFPSPPSLPTHPPSLLTSEEHLDMGIAAAAVSLQSCLTLCDPIDGSHQAPLSLDSLGKNTGVGCQCLLQIQRLSSPYLFTCGVLI